MDESYSDASHQTNTRQAAESLAEGGDAEAQFGLGLKYSQSEDPADYAQAARWYLKAAQQSHALAQYNLGIMYSRGQGVARDKATSLQWMNRAAELGDAGAQYEVGIRQHRLSMDHEGEEARELKIEAYKWLQLSAAQGYGESGTGCQCVAMDMTHGGVAEGKRRAEAFKPATRARD